jgi:hypothetical protein
MHTYFKKLEGRTCITFASLLLLQQQQLNIDPYIMEGSVESVSRVWGVRGRDCDFGKVVPDSVRHFYF